MPITGWIFIIVAMTLIVGGLVFLRNSANATKISDEKMKKIQARKAEMEAREQAEDDD
jgi:membrane protein insertase Oxa1/YidC/SpoIIIJ